MASAKMAFLVLGLSVLLSSSSIAAKRVLLDADINNGDNKDGEIGTKWNTGGEGANMGESWELGGGKGGKKGGGGVGAGGGKGGWGGGDYGGKGGRLPVSPVVPVAPVGGGKGGWSGGGGGGKGGWGGNWGGWSGGGGGAGGSWGPCAACPPQCVRAADWQEATFQDPLKPSEIMEQLEMEEEENTNNHHE